MGRNLMNHRLTRRFPMRLLALAVAIALLIIGGGSLMPPAPSQATLPPPVTLFSQAPPAETPPAETPPAEIPPAEASPTETPPALPDLADPAPISGRYEAESEQFEIGILNDYQVSLIQGAPLFEAPDGHLTYTVQTLPFPDDAITPVTDAALAQAAQDAFEQGEGFRIVRVQPLTSDALEIFWEGRHTAGGNTQPMSGVVLAQQTPEAIFLILIAATETGADRLDGAIAALYETFQPL